ncbi:hypothetical protein EDC01DRAFT_637846 [Geopyxis carbonaria]|nr:hypothetical protein EDC01DRAFT_637846 [Geopyxis carbonaria]
MARPRKPAAPTASTKPTTEPITFTEIPLSQPNRTGRTEKTLLDLIDEHRPKDAPPAATSGAASAGDDEEDLIGPAASTFFFVVPLLMLLGAFDVLVHHQYRQELVWGEIWGRTARGAPVLYAVHYVLHPRRHWITARACLFALAVAAGCYIVTAANKWAYYYSMQYAPALGTLWIWAVVELDLGLAVASCAGVAGYTWWKGYAVIS